MMIQAIWKPLVNPTPAMIIGPKAQIRLASGLMKLKADGKSSLLQYCAAVDTVKFEDAPMKI